MIEADKLYIGEWDNKNEYDDKTDLGGIILGKDQRLMFKMKILNKIVSKDKIDDVNAYSNAIEHYNLYPEDNDKQKLAENLKNYIFLFKVNNKDSNNQSIIAVKKFPKYDTEGRDYQVIPIIYSDSDIPDIKKFQTCLLSEKELSYSHTSELGTDASNGFIIFIDRNKETDNKYLCENADVKKVDANYLIYGLPDSELSEITIRKIKDDQWTNNKFFDDDDNPSMIFIPARELLEENIDDFAPKFSSISSDKETNAGISNDKKYQNEFEEKNINLNNDTQIINRFDQVVQSKQYNLTFSKADLINFHTSVKTNLLTILTGISGTGKTEIVNAYATALGINNCSQFKIISVRPFWQDDSDLIGYVDMMSNNYHPADSGLLDVLQEAEKNPNNLYIILLDEMNLAKVEHYFSQFLSILELKPSQRKLELYSKKLEARLYNSHEYKHEISINNNVRFVGTMNVDESTFQMSNKLLDRANVITLNMQPFEKRNSSTTEFDEKYFNENKITMDNYVIIDNAKKFTSTELNFFWQLHQLLNEALPDVGIGWRSLNSMERFIGNVSTTVTDFDPLDYQVAQRILPRVRGTENMVSSLINLNKAEKLSGKIINLFDDNSDISKFTKSRRVLLEKARELRVYGFAR